MALIELKVDGYGVVSAQDEQAMIILREKEGKRMVPVLSSLPRALTLIARKGFGMRLPVPLNEGDVYAELLHKLNIGIVRVEISAVTDGSFYCKVFAAPKNRVAEDENEIIADSFCKADDGISIAIANQCPICIDEELLQIPYLENVSGNSYALNVAVISRKMLEDALKHAVESEDYEVAARLHEELERRKQ